MTKEQVLKHGEVIKWYCDNPDKGIWYRNYNIEWGHQISPIFHTANEYKYVQNDQYAELRKAQADGKQIQYYDCENVWKNIMDLDRAISYDNMSAQYRIKPDEPVFNVGDWVRLRDTTRIFQIDRIDKHVYPICGDSARFDIESLSLWQPQEGEWVCYTDIENENYSIFKFDSNKFHEEFYNIAPLEFAQTLKDKR